MYTVRFAKLIDEIMVYFRVALTPNVVEKLVKKGFLVNVEKDAGLEAKFRNEDYEKVGAKIVDATKAFQSGNLLFYTQFII